MQHLSDGPADQPLEADLAQKAKPTLVLFEMFETLTFCGSAVAGLATGWLASHCAGLPFGGFRMGLRWMLMLALPYWVLATVHAGVAAGIAALFGTVVGAAAYCCFILELTRRYSG